MSKTGSEATPAPHPSAEAGRPACSGCGGCSRREVLKATAAAAALPAAAALSGCAPRYDTPLVLQTGPLASGFATIPLTRVPEILTSGNAVILQPQAQDDLGRQISILVVKSAKEGLLAFDAYCPHSRCELAWDDAQDEVVCPCHLSRFDASGKVLQGPAVSDLTPFPVKIQHATSQLSIDLSDSAFPDSVGGQFSFAIADVPALQKIDGSLTGHSKGIPFPIIVVRTGAQSVVAYDARCSHLGCAVYGTGAALLICKCHGSLFGLDGAVKQGPATLPLTHDQQLDAAFDGTTVTVKVRA
jgi:cytochrome b6-f complex iron-sulfur subunit